MAFRYEVNGQVVEFDKEPTEKDIDEAAAMLSKSSSKTKQADKPNAVKETVKEAAKQTGRAFAGPGLSEYIPGLESNTTLAAADTGNKIGQNIANEMGVPNEPNLPIEFGQSMRFDVNPNSVTAGMIGGALDPRSVAGMKFAPQVAKSAAGAAERAGMTAMSKIESQATTLAKSSKVMKQAEELTTQILQPTTTELADSIARGRTLPSIKRGAESITKARNFDELVGSLKNTTKELFEERNAILGEFNKPVGNEVLESLEEFATIQNKSRRYSPNQLKIIDEVASREAQFLNDNPSIDIIKAQARKEELQKLTSQLLEKRKAGTISGRESMELQAYDALRSGYRKAILKALPREKAAVVDKINSKYEGMVDATELAAKQQAKAVKEIPNTLPEKISAVFGWSPKYTTLRFLTKEYIGLAGQSKLAKTTQKVADLRAKSELLKFLAGSAKKTR